MKSSNSSVKEILITFIKIEKSILLKRTIISTDTTFDNILEKERELFRMVYQIID
jgi:methylglyoxal synthase